ncbi:MAG: 50S ribosomal protein L24 [Actinomycetota bacterium]|jgi:large subunit ribosomal protein L24|nr:50S ribosomal protein L24 [Actinomycetota bacterium]MDA3014601.1 50S ribosomal protein L24 [Actinomycetota bacterium]MDA3027302.1 50S ribosomal protein L24 [Actinomycetota bacterium]
MKIRKGDTVLVIAGKDKGKEGEVIRVLPKQDKVVVGGVNTAARHQRPRRANEQGGIVDKDMPIHVSNVMLVHKGKPVRIGYRTEADGTKVRVARPSGEVIK